MSEACTKNFEFDFANLFDQDKCWLDELAGIVTEVYGLVVKRTAVASTGQ